MKPFELKVQSVQLENESTEEEWALRVSDKRLLWINSKEQLVQEMPQLEASLALYLSLIHISEPTRPY